MRSSRRVSARRLSFESLEDRRLLFAPADHRDINECALGSFITQLGVDYLDRYDTRVDYSTAFGALPGTSKEHFDNSQFLESENFINEQYKNAIGDANPARFRGIDLVKAAGTLLHPIQDFYAHSNWVNYPELRNTLVDDGGGPFMLKAPPGFVFLEKHGSNGAIGFTTNSDGKKMDLFPGKDLTIKVIKTHTSTGPDDMFGQVFVSGTDASGNPISYKGIVTGSFPLNVNEAPKQEKGFTHGELTKDKLIKNPHDAADIRKNEIHDAALELACKQTKQEFARLGALISAEYGKSGIDKLLATAVKRGSRKEAMELIDAALATTPVSQPAITISPTSGFSFTVNAGDPDPRGVLKITNSGAPGSSLTYTVNADTQGKIVLDGPVGGSLSGGENNSIDVSVKIAGIAPGATFHGVILIHTDLPGADGLISVPVTVTVKAVSAPVLTVTPHAMSFTATQGGPDPASQSFTVANSGSTSTTLHYSVTSDDSRVTADGTTTPLSGGQQSSWTVNVDTSGLQPNTYHASITVTDLDDNKTQTIAVTYTVKAAVASSLTGTWSGTWTQQFGGFGTETWKLTWVLTQTGNSVTGTYVREVTATDGLVPDSVGDKKSGSFSNGQVTGGTHLTLTEDGGTTFSDDFTATQISGTGTGGAFGGQFSVMR